MVGATGSPAGAAGRLMFAVAWRWIDERIDFATETALGTGTIREVEASREEAKVRSSLQQVALPETNKKRGNRDDKKFDLRTKRLKR